MSHSIQEKMGNYNADDKKEHRLMRKGLAVALAGAVVLGAAGCSGDKVGAQAPEVKPSTTTESVAEPTETVEDYVDSMEVYGEMSVEEFESLPIDDRLQYAQFLKDITEYRGVYENIYGSGRPGEDQRVDFVTPAIDNSGEDIWDNYRYTVQLAFQQYNGMQDGRALLDQGDAQKMLSYMFYDVGENVKVRNKYLSLKEQIVGTEYATIMESEDLSFIGGDNLSNGTHNSSGQVLNYKDVEYSLPGQSESHFVRFVFYEFKSYDNRDAGVWLIESDGSSIESLSGDSNIH